MFIKELDTLDIELNEILGRLKSVALDPGFDAVNAPELRQLSPPRKSLHDFVDEQGIEQLKTQLRQAIDEVQVPPPASKCPLSLRRLLMGRTPTTFYHPRCRH